MRAAPEGVMEIFLQPGEFWFGDSQTRIRTILGSCVSITAWHPRLRVGAMSHYLVPSRRRSRVDTLDGKHGDESVMMMFREFARHGTNPHDYQFKIFGGGDMFGKQAASDTIGTMNADSGLRLLHGLGHQLTARHLRGQGHRQIVFDVWSGDVWVRQHKLMPPLGVERAAA